MGQHGVTSDVVLYDTTLRDDAQANGVSFRVDAKLAALELLDPDALEALVLGLLFTTVSAGRPTQPAPAEQVHVHMGNGVVGIAAGIHDQAVA